MSDDFIQPQARITQAELDAQKRKGWTDFHPETYCHRCGGPNISWHIDSENWNRVMRPNGEDGRWGEIICPICFVELAGLPHVELSLSASESEIANATRLGFELGKAEGRKQAGEEIAQGIEAVRDSIGLFPIDNLDDLLTSHQAFTNSAQIARDVASQPQEATSEPLTASTRHSDLPEDAKASESRGDRP